MKAFFLSFIFISFFSSLKANTTDIFFDFLRENQDVILDVQENKIYIDKKNISIENNGFTITNPFGKEFRVKELFSDDRGIYIDVSSITKTAENIVWNLVYCKTCKTYRSINMEGKCNVCGKKPSE